MVPCTVDTSMYFHKPLVLYYDNMLPGLARHFLSSKKVYA